MVEHSDGWWVAELRSTVRRSPIMGERGMEYLDRGSRRVYVLIMTFLTHACPHHQECMC